MSLLLKACHNDRVSILGVIPARYASTRFPGKPLVDIAGKSLIQRVWERASGSKLLNELLIATDDQRIFDHVASFGGQVVLTRADHASGTDRLGEVAERRVYEYYINIQGDEPLLPPADIDKLATHTLKARALMSTLIAPLNSTVTAEVENPDTVKVVCDHNGYALYFSRALIPYPRRTSQATYYKHIGIYMYSRETLLQLCNLKPAPLELAESLEQLRALSHGIRVLCVPTDYDPVDVDTPEDVERVIEALKNS